MVKAIELKQGTVVNFKEQSYLIIQPDFCSHNERLPATNLDNLELELKKISCPCGGNLEKLGRVKGQYKCVECNSPIFLKENGELEE